MKRKYVVLLIVIILLALLIPIPKYLNDGGTVEYKSLIYKISVVHRSNEYSETKYDDGVIIEILGLQVYNNLVISVPGINVVEDSENLNILR